MIVPYKGVGRMDAGISGETGAAIIRCRRLGHIALLEILTEEMLLLLAGDGGLDETGSHVNK